MIKAGTMKIKINKARRQRIAEAKEWLKQIDTNISIIELRNLYKKKFNVNNICIYRDLACLGFKEAKIKVKNYEEKIKRKNNNLKVSILEFNLYENTLAEYIDSKENVDTLMFDDDLPF